MSLKINELKIVLENSGLEKEDIDKVLKSAEIFYDFSDFLKEKLELSDEAVELMFQLKIRSSIAKMDDDIIMDDDKIVDAIANLYADFAKEHGYEKCEKLREDAKALISMSMNNN